MYTYLYLDPHRITLDDHADLNALRHADGKTGDRPLTHFEDMARHGLVLTARDTDRPRAMSLPIVGVAVLIPLVTLDDRRSRIHSVIVHPDHRRRGIARHLVTALLERAKHVGCSFVDGDSALHREGAHALYEKLGAELRQAKPFRMKLDPA